MTVGTQLQEARKAKKLSVADVTATTKIQPWVVEAIETDRLQEAMSPIYVKGFIGSYARFLGLNPQAVVSQLVWAKTDPVLEPAVMSAPVMVPAAAPRPAPVQARTQTQPVQAQAQPQVPVAPPAPGPEFKLPEFQMPSLPSLPPLSMPNFTLPRVRLPRARMPRVRLPRFEFEPVVIKRAGISLAAVAALAAVIAINPAEKLSKVSWPKLSLPQMAKADAKKADKKADAKKSDKKAVTAKAPAKPASPVEELSSAPKLASVAPIGEPATLPTPSPQAVATTQPLELKISANKTTWIKVTADGKLLTQQRLSRGANERWTAKKQFELIISKPTQVDITLNGQPISPFAVAHKGRVLITHRGVTRLPDE